MSQFEEWTIAYRIKEENALLIDERKREFHIIKNTWRYWCADPHLFEYEGDTYVFAELYDRVLRKGVIGCCKITKTGYTPWKVVLKMPWHLSYPHVFCYKDEISARRNCQRRHVCFWQYYRVRLFAYNNFGQLL